MKDKLFPSDFKPFLQDILTKIQSTRYEMDGAFVGRQFRLTLDEKEMATGF